MRRSVTIKDVARVAGVSVATVSRVCSGGRLVSDSRRRAVEAAIRDLGYVPNGTARSLITSRTNAIGVLLPDVYGEVFSEIIRGIDSTTRHRGYHLLVSSSRAQRVEIRAALGSMRGRVDGLIVMSAEDETATEVEDLPAAVPIVVLNRPTDRVPSVSVENFEGATAMVRHLVRMGHRRIAIITGPAHNQDAAERLRGYRTALREAGIEIDPLLELAGHFTEASGYEAARAVVGWTHRPTAVFAANDSMAIGALSAFREYAVRVPADVAVAGFDDIQIARYMNPPLSSVHVDIAGLGARAAAILLDGIAEPASRRAVVRVSIPTQLAIRGSCGATGAKHGDDVESALSHHTATTATRLLDAFSPSHANVQGCATDPSSPPRRPHS